MNKTDKLYFAANNVLDIKEFCSELTFHFIKDNKEQSIAKLDEMLSLCKLTIELIEELDDNVTR